MVPLVNRPVLEHVLEHVACAGLKEIVIATSGESQPMIEHFGSGQRWGVRLIYVERHTLGAVLRWASHEPAETLLVLPGDAPLDCDLAGAIAYHRAHGRPATLAAVALERALGEEPRAQAAAPPAACLLSAAHLREACWLADVHAFDDLPGALLDGAAACAWFDTPRCWGRLTGAAVFHEAQQRLLSEALSGHADAPAGDSAARHDPLTFRTRRIAPGVRVGRNTAIHPSARLIAPLYIGHDCWIGANAELGPGVVCGDEVFIDAGATIRASTVLARTYVGRSVAFERRIIGEAGVVDVASGRRLTIDDPLVLAPAAGQPSAPAFPHVGSILLAALCLLALVPLLAVLCLLALFASGGRLLRREARITNCTTGSSERPLQVQVVELLAFETRREDGTTTALGRWLEAWELHRLPELLNVIRGDLALVGPMPLTLEQTMQLAEEWQIARLDYAAGFTGAWYTDLQAADDLNAVLVSDLYYAVHRTRASDARLLLLTLVAWLRRRAAPAPASEAAVQLAQGDIEIA